MDREIPSGVPITTLAGVASLTDLLPEMPLPTPILPTSSNKSLLFHPRVAEEARNLLGLRDQHLVPHLVHSLVSTSAEHIELKDNYAGSGLKIDQDEDLPELLRAILDTSPSVFSNNRKTWSNNPQQPHWNHMGHEPQANNSLAATQSCTPVTTGTSVAPADNTTTATTTPTPETKSAADTCINAPQPAQQNATESEVQSTSFENDLDEKPSENELNEQPKSSKLQPIVRLGRLSEEDQQLMQKSLAKFAENRPELAKELGIMPEMTEESETDSESTNKTKDRPKRKSALRKVEDDSTNASDGAPVRGTRRLRSRDEDDEKPKRRKYDEDGESEEDDEEEESGRRKKKMRKLADDDYSPDREESLKRKTKDTNDIFSELVSSNRKKKTVPSKPEPVMVKPKLRRVEKKFVPVLEKLSIEELMETNTYDRFNKTIENVLKTVDEQDITDLTDDGMVNDDLLLRRIVMTDLCSEAAKLKSLGAMEMIPTDKLIRLLNVLEINIRGGDRVSPITDEDNESIRQMWMEQTMDRVMGAADASLICMYIMTSQNMPKRVYLEEVIDRVVLFIKFHQHNTLFPSFDTTYRLDNKKKDGRRKKSTQACEKGITHLYSKTCELVKLLAELLNIQVLTDTSILHLSSMGVSPFFVENVSELQLSCLKLVTTIFARYETHRRILLDDILASIARLPNTKRSLRTYRLNSEEHIQMLTALVLQLIQCVVSLPENDKKNDSGGDKLKNVDKDVLIPNKYEKATSTAGTFLTVFLGKCGNKSEDIDYRPLFENFVQDLLTTVNKPEWPATELLLSLLGKLLLKNFSDKGVEMSLRVASLDYLGVIAARLRRDSVLSHKKLNTIDQMINDIKSEEIKDIDEDSTLNKKQLDTNTEEERIQFLQRVLLDFLAINMQGDQAYKHARHFYIAQWYKDAISEKNRIASGKAKKAEKVERVEEENGEYDGKVENNKESIERQNAARYRYIEEKKKFLISKIRPFHEKISSGNRVQVFQTYIDYNSAELIAQYLASKRSFSQSFDIYLKMILFVLKETSIAIRTKAMKCLTMIVEADPSVLGRHDMQIGVNHSFLDHSTSVREAAVDLVGKFVLSRPELINTYYETLSNRILDTGVSVRKRVIKILKDICIECPSFPKIPEICVKMIRRVNDEEGIRKLVMEVFQNMWFTPTDEQTLLRRVMNITDVVVASKDIGLEWFEQLLTSLFKPREDKEDSTKIQAEPPKLMSACKQIVDCLIENVLNLDGMADNSGTSQRLVACVTTLYLFAKIRPQLLVDHASTLQPYLSLKCQTPGDVQIIKYVAKMLELVVPMLEHPSESFLAQLEEDSMKLILRHERSIIASCMSCLGSIVNSVTHNFKLIRDCFKKYYDYLANYKNLIENGSAAEIDTRSRQFLRRSLFSVGLLLRHFDFEDPRVFGDLPTVYQEPNIVQVVYRTLMCFVNQEDLDLRGNALKAIGSACIRHYEFMQQEELRVIYHDLLTSMEAPINMKTEVLVNIEAFLIEEEKRMIQNDLEWAKRSKQENLKEMGDVLSGRASSIIQVYLKEILTSYMHPSLQVRQPALRVVQLILQQGLVHPFTIVPCLICMSTDPEKLVSHPADKQLLEIDKKYPGFVHAKSSQGIRLSFELQNILQDVQVIRGIRLRDGDQPIALNGYLYSILRNSRQQRRALVLNILKQFDEQARTTLSNMLYLADNLAHFPYVVQDEPLFIVHHIDIMISVSGTNLLQTFRESLIMTDAQKLAFSANPMGPVIEDTISALDEDDDEAALLARVPEDTSQLQACLTAAQGCLLLLVLKQHLKDVYGLSDSKIQQYSPSEPAKVYEKTVTRKGTGTFHPRATINKLKQGAPPEYLDEEGRKDLIRQYLNFKQLMLQLDPDDVDEEENSKVLTALSTTANVIGNSTPATSVFSETEKNMLANYKQDTTPKVPKLVISNRRLDSDRRTSRSHKSTEKLKKHRHKKKRRKFVSSSGDESENDYSDPDFMA